MITKIKINSTPTISQLTLSVCLCVFCVVRTKKSTLSYLQVYIMVLLTIAFMLYSRSLELTHFTKESSYPWLHLPISFSPQQLLHGNPHFIHCFYKISPTLFWIPSIVIPNSIFLCFHPRIFDKWLFSFTSTLLSIFQENMTTIVIKSFTKFSLCIYESSDSIHLCTGPLHLILMPWILFF